MKQVSSALTTERTIKALVKDKYGVQVTERPDPQVVDDHDVLVRVALTGICRTDLYVAMGLVPRVPDTLILGHECSGVVEQVGAAVERVAPGDRVAVMPILPVDGATAAHPYACYRMLGLHRDGSLCDCTVVPDTAVYPIPDTMTFMQAAYMEPVAASLAVLQAGLRPGERGLMIGDNRIAELTHRILEMGGIAGVTICGADKETLRALPADSYDFIIETMATTATMKAMIRTVRPGGRLVLKSWQWKPVSVLINDLVRKDIQLTAVHYGDFAEGIRLVAQGQLAVDDLFGTVSPLEDFGRVFDEAKHIESKKLFMTSAPASLYEG